MENNFLYRCRKLAPNNIPGKIIIKEFTWFLSEIEIDYPTVEKFDLELIAEGISYYDKRLEKFIH